MVNEKTMTYTQMNQEIRRQLADSGVENAAFEAAELICWAAEISKETFLLKADQVFPPGASQRLRPVIRYNICSEHGIFTPARFGWERVY